MSKPTFYMMVGISGSGKSTYTKEMKGLVVETDNLRRIILGDENDQTQNGKVFNFALELVNFSLYKGIDCVLDATSLTKRDRRRCMKKIESDCKKVAVFIDMPLEVCLAQNRMRERKVPEEVIKRQYERLQPPELSEGFDEIIFANPL